MQDPTVTPSTLVALPVDDAVVPDVHQPELPLDDPVPYALTARARLLVADAALPALQVVDGGGGGPAAPVDLDEVDDTHRVRARALHRAGVAPLDIADELDVDPLHVEVWVADLPAGGGLRVVRGGRPGASGPAGATVAGAAESHAQAAAARAEAWDAAADAGLREAAERLRAQPGLRAGLGLLGGVLREDRHAVVLDGSDAELVVAAWAWLRVTLAVPTDGTRVLVRHAAVDAGDRHAHRLATRLGVAVGAVTTSRDPGASADRPHVRVRLADPELAGRAAGWRRLLLAELTRHPALHGHGAE